jgi:hypothetical protein
VVLVHGYVDGNVFKGGDLGVSQHLAVDDGLDLFQLLIGYLGKVGEVEAQAVGMDRRAGLLDVGAEDLAERGVEEVGSGVVAADGVAAFSVHYSADVVTDGQGFLEQGFVGADALDR